MSESVSLALVTPERLVFDVTAKEVTIPAFNGEMQALPFHTPYFTELSTGILSFTRSSGDIKRIAVSGGFAEVLPEKVTILVRTAELPDEIDRERAEKAKDRAEKRLAGSETGTDFDRASASLQRAIARLSLLK